MDKPISMSVKDYIIRIYSVKNRKEESLIDAIVSHQFQALHENMNNNNSLEMSNFGRFNFNKIKAKKTLEKELSKKEHFLSIINDEQSTEAKKASAENKLKDTLEIISYINKKLWC